MADLTDLREAYRAKLTADATIKTLLGAIPGMTPAQYPIFYRQIRREMLIPSVMLSDAGTLPDLSVPLHDRTVRADVFHEDFERAEAICKRIKALWDDQPLTATGWRVMMFRYTGDGEQGVEEGDVIQRAAEFRLLAYEAT
jgi:hypothetical protein